MSRDLGEVIGKARQHADRMKDQYVSTEHLLLALAEVKSEAREVLSVNAVDAGIGDRVLLIDEGNSARQILGDPAAPVRTLVAGIIDEIDE